MEVKFVSNPKRHHFIPKMLLQHFVDEEGMLFFFNRQLRRKGILRTNPRNLFVEGHLYSFNDLEGTRDPSTEELLAKVESDASPIVNKIINNAREGELPNLSLHEKEIWAVFIYLLWSRLPAMRDSSASSQAQLDEQQRAYRFVRGFADNEALDVADFEEFLQQEIWPRAIQGSNEFIERSVIPTLQDMSLWVAIGSPEHAESIIGSYPIIKARPNLDLDHESAEIWMPLAHDVAVVLRHHRQEALCSATDEFTQKLNERVFDQSTIVAGRSREQIESLAAVANNS